MTTQNTVIPELSLDGDIPPYLKHILQLTTNNNEEPVKTRMFYIIDGKVIFGVLLLETSDSFLVGAPSRLIKKGTQGDIEVDLMYDGDILRLMKSSVAIVTKVPERYKFLVTDFLCEVGIEKLPDFMDEDRLDYLRSEREAFGTADLPVSYSFKDTDAKEGSHLIQFPGSVAIH